MSRGYLLLIAEEQRLKDGLIISHRLLRSASNPLDLPTNNFVAHFILTKPQSSRLCKEVFPLLKPRRNPDLKVLAAVAFYANGAYQKNIGAYYHLGLSQTSCEAGSPMREGRREREDDFQDAKVNIAEGDTEITDIQFDVGGFLGLLPESCDGGNASDYATTLEKQFCRRYNENNKINYTYDDWADRQRIKANGIYCNATCDGYLCWPPTPAGETFYQNCPKGLLSNEKMCAFRRCGSEGMWLGRHLNDTSPKGWTNYTPCFPKLVQEILDKVNEDEAEAQFKFETAGNTRTIEMVGIVSSFLTICAAIFIFNAFSSLHNRRTVIHRHLFYALLMELTVRMVLYTQQSHAFDDGEPLEENARRGIEYFPYICEGAYVLLEYSRLVVYGWMLIEGIFLNTLISANALRNEIPINYFYSGGWGVPAIVTVIWVIVVGIHYSEEPLNTCWYGYNYLPSYYIIQGPILAIVLINMLFLGTIMSVVIMKLRRTNDSELRKIQKAIRATLILLPLLGIINIFNLFDYPLDGSSTGFAIWAYLTHFFRSFQGVFISFIYCFSNGEVRKAISKKWERRIWCRFEWFERSRRASPPAIPVEQLIFAVSDENLELVPVEERTWTRSPSTQIVDIEAGTSNTEALPDTIMPANNRLGRNDRLPRRPVPNGEPPGVRFRDDEQPQERGQARDEPAPPPTQNGPNLRESNTLYPNQEPGVRFRDDEQPQERGRPRMRAYIRAGGQAAPPPPPQNGPTSISSITFQVSRPRVVRFQDIENPPEGRRHRRAHSASSFPTQLAPNLRDSDCLHPNRLYAVSCRDAKAMFKTLTGLLRIAQAQLDLYSPANQDRRHSDTIYPNRSHAASPYFGTGASTSQAHSSTSHAASPYFGTGASTSQAHSPTFYAPRGYSEPRAHARDTSQAHSSTSHTVNPYFGTGASTSQAHSPIFYATRAYSEPRARARDTSQAHSSTSPAMSSYFGTGASTSQAHSPTFYAPRAYSEPRARARDTSQAHSSSSPAVSPYFGTGASTSQTHSPTFYAPRAYSEPRARARDTSQAHSSSSPAVSPYFGTGASTSQTHSPTFYAPRAYSEPRARARGISQAHRSTNTDAAWSQQRFQYSGRGEMPSRLRASLDIPVSVPQARELIRYNLKPARLARANQNYEEDDFDRRFRDLEENRASSSENVGRMPVRLNPFRYYPARFNYVCCYPHENAAPRRSRSLVKADLDSPESPLHDGKAESTCF